MIVVAGFTGGPGRRVRLGRGTPRAPVGSSTSGRTFVAGRRYKSWRGKDFAAEIGPMMLDALHRLAGAATVGDREWLVADGRYALGRRIRNVDHRPAMRIAAGRLVRPVQRACWHRIAVVTTYRPMTLADLARHVLSADNDKVRWKLVWEFLEEYRWEPADVQVRLFDAEPEAIGDERWDALLAALAEHLSAQHNLAPPEWAEPRVLCRAWFPAELAIQRADALIWAPAAFRKHGVYLSVHDLAAA